jgi:5-methylcytosine-specific restriction endonuclease McrA
MNRYKKDISKLSLRSLRMRENKSKETLRKLMSSLISHSDYLAHKNRYEESQKERESIDIKISNLKKIKEPRPGFVSAIFGSKQTPPEVLAKINDLEKSKDLIDIAESRNITFEYENTIDKIKHEERNLELIKKCIQINLNSSKESKRQSLINKAAENAEKKRKIAGNIKKHLVENEWCPYCGIRLSDDKHADHIYPIAKGGESTIKNMVFVCVNCNSKKKDMTLQMFIKKFQLDRNKIEKTLEEMGKEF